jgi:hypothetical protein
MDLDLYAAIGILLLISALFTIGGNYILNNNNYNKFFKTSTFVDVQHILKMIFILKCFINLRWSKCCYLDRFYTNSIYDYWSFIFNVCRILKNWRI